MASVKADPLLVNDVFAAPDWLKAAFSEMVAAQATLAELVFSPDGALPLRIMGGAPVLHHAIPYLSEIQNDMATGTLAAAPPPR